MGLILCCFVTKVVAWGCPDIRLRLILSARPGPAPEPSGISSAVCAGGLRNPPEPFRNLLLQLRRIAPELFWAKDPIASFAVGEKTNKKH